MAKSKKSTTGEGAAPKKATASKGKKSAKPARQKEAAGQQQAPMIDTDLAASAAARQLAAKAKLQGTPQPPAEEQRKESAAFKQLKGNLNKPASSGLNTAMGNTFGQSKSNLPGPSGGKQVAHNQTQGGFSARTNVPRRTNG